MKQLKVKDMIEMIEKQTEKEAKKTDKIEEKKRIETERQKRPDETNESSSSSGARFGSIIHEIQHENDERLGYGTIKLMEGRHSKLRTSLIEKAMPVKKKIKKVDKIGARKGKINQLINRFSSGGSGDGKGTLASQESECDENKEIIDLGLSR